MSDEKQPENKKRKPGRQVQHKITDKEIRQVEYLAGLGLKTQDIANVLGMARSTLWEKFKESQDLSDAINRGKAKATMEVTQSAFQQATSGKSPAMTIFWLKVRCGWKDPLKVESENTITFTTQIGKDGSPQRYEEMED